MTRGRILLATPSLAKHDAVSNDLLIQREILMAAGYEVYLYSEYAHDDLENLICSKDALNHRLSDKHTRVIYHHSIHWKQGDAILNLSCGNVFLCYHNITPPEFFENYDHSSLVLTKSGREQTVRIVKSGRIFKYLSDSNYNSNDLLEAGAQPQNIIIRPPFHKVPDFDNVSLNSKLIDQLGSRDSIKLLFVGRVSPNKGHKHIIGVVREFLMHYDQTIEVHFIGGLWPNDAFLIELEEYINSNKLGGHVFFHRQLSFSDMKTYYFHCDLFILMSEHEGFCVPIIEAQHNKLPIVALDRTAVAETLGKDQLAIAELDYKKFAAAIYVVSKNREYKEYLINSGLRNLERFNRDVLAQQFLQIIEGGG